MEENKEIKKTNNKMMILIMVVVGLVLCVGSFFLGQILANKEDETLNKDDKEETKEEIVNKEEEKEEEKIEVSFDRTKCINCKFVETDIVEVMESDEGVDFISYEFNSDDRKKITLTANVYNFETELKEDVSYVLTFDKKVVDVAYVGLSPDLDSDTFVFFLLEDGTIQYVKYDDIKYQNKCVLKSIENVADIVKFDILYIDYQRPTEQRTTIIAYKSDGTFYDLKFILEPISE